MLIDVVGLPLQSWLGMGIMAFLGLLYWLLKNFVNSSIDRIKKLEDKYDDLVEKIDDKHEKVDEIITAIRIKIGDHNK